MKEIPPALGLEFEMLQFLILVHLVYINLHSSLPLQDFDFYDLNGMSYGLDTIQAWLERVSRIRTNDLSRFCFFKTYALVLQLLP